MPQLIIETSNLESNIINSTPMPPLAELHGERLAHFSERPVTLLFEEQVARDADAIAVVCGNSRLSFRELNARANQLARHLRALGVGRESLVGLCIDRSVEMAVGILGILKSGAAYLPLDPEYPTERLSFMLADARPAVVLTKAELNVEFPAQTKVVLLDQDWTAISKNPDENLAESPAPADLAYVIYTSGSTGKPKGVMIAHGNLANYLLALNREIGIESSDRYLHTASIAFSSSRRQLLLPLSQGASVVIASSDQRKDPLALFRMIKNEGVTAMDAVPSFWRNCTSILADLLAAERRELLDNRLRLMLSASEPLLSNVPRTWMTGFNHPARHIHMFGQTETAGIISLFHVPETIEPDVYVPVGKPIANTDVYVLDANNEVCPIGVAGELYIGGAGVGRGYLNRSELTAQKFVERNGARLYRTGDWARVSPEGRIEFAGRQDQQVKLRGFRVELGEIEAALAQHPSIRECVVIAREIRNATASGDKRLVAYFVPRAAALSAGELRTFLTARLPDYSVPAAFVEMKALPLSANGKVDRLRLPEPENSRAGLANEFVAPQSDIERRLAKIWSDVLRAAPIGRDDNFFELGGHSLLAAQIVARIRREFQFEAPISTLFECPTIRVLAERIGSGGSTARARSIQPADRGETAPLSLNQQQFWLLDQSSPNPCAYNVQAALNISGRLEVERLQQAIDTVISRHEILRTNIVAQDGSLMQVIAHSRHVELRVSVLSDFPEHQREVETERVFAEEAGQPFDLSNKALLRTRLLRLAENEHVLIVTLHHIVCDGWSIGILLRELTHSYLKNIAAATEAVPQLPIQYADFAVWQRQALQGEAIASQLNYWKQRMANAPAALDLPTDYLRPATRRAEGARVSTLLSRELTAALTQLGRHENATLFMTLLAAFQILLFRYSGQEDVIVGSPVAGRTMIETENLIGAFVNTLVLRADVSGNPTFREVLVRARETVLGAFSHQDLPFEKLVEVLNPERKANRSSVFQVMFSFQTPPAPELEALGMKFAPRHIANDSAKFDLSLDVEQATGGLSISLSYATDLYERATIERMLEHFQNLLAGAVADPARCLDDLPLLDDHERKQLLVDWNRKRIDVPQDVRLHQLFEAYAEKTPEAIAVEFQGEKLTYRDLNERANQLANYLQKQGVGPEVLVGIAVERSPEMIVALLGVLKAGGGYVPLDPNYPRERIAFMIEDADLSVVVTEERVTRELLGNAKLVCLDRDWEMIAQEPKQPPIVQALANNVALVIYTSGSTGNPKGVVLEHRSLVHYCCAASDAYAISCDDRVLQFASLSFDMSAEEIYLTLSRGATLVLRSDEMISSAEDFFAYCKEHRITVLDLPTAYWHELTDALTAENLDFPESVRLVIIGGEKASADRVQAWHRRVQGNVRLVNTYGPTEITIAATVCDLEPCAAIAAGIVPIGRPLPNTSVYVLDQSLRLIPTGVPGELYVGGPGVARGYLNRAEVTTEKFIQNPFSDDPGDRLYKTGDVVRYRADGQLEFLGRIDNQIKIRGFRVELEEIERALRLLDSVSDCIVVLREDYHQRLVAYVVPETIPPTASELRNFLKAKLPAYMVPAAFEIIDAVPLMPNGKTDRHALPEPTSPADAEGDFVAPATPIQEILAAAWRDVLRTERVSIHDNFFDLGGHSLLAAKIVSLVRNDLNVPFSMVDVFQAPTVATLAELLYPRVVAKESPAELASLLAGITAMSDEAAQGRMDSELRFGEAAPIRQARRITEADGFVLDLERQLASLSSVQRALFEQRLTQKGRRAKSDLQVIKRQADRRAGPLSYNQQGLWVLDRLMAGATVYHAPTAARLTGKLDIAALTKALQTIVERHDGLRTSFETIDGTPAQVVREFSLEAPMIDLSDKPENEREPAALDILRREAHRPFDLSQGPLIRAVLVRMQAQDHILLVTMHHIVTDGWSVGIFHRELSRLYEAFTAGQASPLAELPIQYLDYSVWQRDWFDGEVYESQLAYWKEQFATLPPPLELPADHPRSGIQAHRAFRGEQQTITLPADFTLKIKQTCQKEGATLFMILMAAYQVVLHRYTGEEDITVGTPIAGRPQPETEDLIGLFINTLALRADLSGDPTFREFLNRVKQVSLGAYEHQDLPFERLVKELQPDRTPAHNPLFQVMFVLQSEEIPPLQLPGLTTEHVHVQSLLAHFDLTLDVVEKDDRLVCRFESNAELFETATIARMMRHFETLLAGIIENPERKISELPLLTDAERRQLLLEWNDTRTNYPANQSIQELFEQQVAMAPDAVALISDDQELSYREINQRANQLAHYLRRRGVIADTRVGICMQRSPEMIIAILGILKSGGAYVPLDPAYPQARLEFMLEDANAPLLLTQTALAPNLPAHAARVICVDDIDEQLATEDKQNPKSVTTADNLAYVMYTSGSTGKPKGVAVMHRNVVRLVKNTNYASFSADEVFLQASTISFDASTFEIWGSLLNGARLVLLPAGTPSLKELGQAVKRHGVTTLWLTAGLFHLMVENHLDDLRGVRQLLAGGDVLSVPHVQKVFRELKNCRLINGYGPTENTTFTCCYPVHDLSKVNGSVPIGFPISNTSVYVLDRCMNPAPIGVPGELYIGGDGLARGYLDRPELTSERFVPDPFSENGGRLYRTGDLVRHRATGEIEFIGRIDNQVKVRGFRIELGEIEAALMDHPGVREAVVVARKDSGDKHLAAYLVPRNGNLSDKDVREFLQSRLPEYMMPSVFVSLESLPLSPVGKVDRHALPAPGETHRDSHTAFVAPENEIELKLTRIWERVLDACPIGTDENFFELGGHSLLAVRLFAEIEKTFGKNLPLAILFESPTVKELAHALRDEGWQPSWSSLVMIQAGGQHPPFFSVHAAGGNVLEYRDLARLLGPDQPFYGFQAQGLDGKRAPHTTIKEMAAHYIGEMREVQPEGPYLLGGRSSGGTIAFEMACQLSAAGEKVALLALLDTFPSGYFKLLPGATSVGQRVVRRLKKWQSHVTNLGHLNASDKVRYLVNKLRYAPAKAKHKIYRRAYKIYQKFGKPLPPVLRNIEEINFAAVKDYEPQIYAGDVTLFLATDLTADYDSKDGWRELVQGKIETYEIPGNHLNIIREPGVQVLAEKLRASLSRVRAQISQ